MNRDSCVANPHFLQVHLKLLFSFDCDFGSFRWQVWFIDKSKQYTHASALAFILIIDLPLLFLPKHKYFLQTNYTILNQILFQELEDSFNYGLFQPPLNGRAGKFLDEERRLSEYPFQGSVGHLEVRIWHQSDTQINKEM